MEIKDTVLDDIIKARLNKAVFYTIKDKLLYAKFI
jgi:hypothetical protein